MKSRWHNLLFLPVLAISACDQNSVDQDGGGVAEDVLPINSQYKVVDGTLNFSDLEEFQSFYKNVLDLDETEFASFMESEFYSNGFYSLMPSSTELSEQRLFKQHNNELERTGVRSRSSESSSISIDDYRETVTDLEDVFGEERFASLLNLQGEIEVGGEIYKYTDTGIFTAAAGDKVALENHFQKQSISSSFFDPTPVGKRSAYLSQSMSKVEVCDMRKEQGRFLPTPVADEDTGKTIAKLYLPADDCGTGGGTSTPTTTTTTTTSSVPTVATSDEVNQVLQRIEDCDIEEPWLSNMFGTVKTCYDQYDGDHRVKIKYFSSDYLLAYHVGLKVKHQKKGWTGLWRKQDVEQMAAGVNSVSWSYTPKILSFPQQSFPTNFYVRSTGELYSTYQSYTNAEYQGKKNIPLPQLPFIRDADVVVELLVNDFGALDTEREVREFFYKNLFNTAKGVLNSAQNQAQPKELNAAAVILTTPTHMWIQYYNFAHQCTNCSLYDKTFDFGAVTPKISYQFANGGGFSWGDFGVSGYDFDFDKPNTTGISAYGLAKKDGSWHGRKMVWGD